MWTAMLNIRLTVSFTTHGRPVRLPPPGYRESGSLFLLHFPFPSPRSEQISLDPLSSDQISGPRRHRPPPADRADLAPLLRQISTLLRPISATPPPVGGRARRRSGSAPRAGRREAGGAAGPAAGGVAGPAAGGGRRGGAGGRKREPRRVRRPEARQGRRSPPAPAVGRREAQRSPPAPAAPDPVFFFAKNFQHFF